MKEIYLFQLNKELKVFLSIFLLVLSSGVIFGLIYLYKTTSFNKSITTERLIENDDLIEEDFGINESTSRSTGELLMTIHNHIIGFSFIFFLVGGIFYFNSIISGFWKMFLILEPLISTLISFSSMLGIRFINEAFVYITIISAILLYLSYFIMISISLIELTLKRPV